MAERNLPLQSMAEKSSALMEETTTIRLETSLDHCIVMRFVQRTKSNMNASSIKVKRRFLPFLPGCTSDLWWPRARGRSTLANEGTMPSRPGSPGAETRDLTNGTYTFPASASFALGRLLAGLVRGVRALRTDPPNESGCSSSIRRGLSTAGEAAPQTDKACTVSLPGASLPGALYPSQPRPFTHEATFGNLAQQAARSARGAVREDRRGSRHPGGGNP